MNKNTNNIYIKRKKHQVKQGDREFRAYRESLKKLPAWYWKSGLHDTQILDAIELGNGTDKKSGKYYRNCLVLSLDSSGALYDFNVKKIIFYNYEVRMADVSVSKLSNTKINMQTVAANISQAFITFANTLDNNLTALDIEGKTARSAKRLGMIMTPISSLLDTIKNYEFGDNTITYIDENGKKITIENYTKKIENLGTFISKLYSSLKIKDDSNENFFQKLGIGDGTNKLSNLLETISASSSGIISLMTTTIPDEKQTIWYHFNNIKMSSDNKTPALQKQAELINEFGTAIKNIDDIIFKNDTRRIEAIKKYTEEVTKLATQMSSLAESTKIVAEKQIVNVNETSNANANTTNDKASDTKTKQSTTTATDKPNTKTEVNTINYEDLKNAIIDAFSNKQIKVSFDDSLEDLIGDLSLV